MVTVKINHDKWKQNTLVFPGLRPIRKPMFRDTIDYTPQVAQILIEQGYVFPIDEKGVAIVSTPKPKVVKKNKKEDKNEDEKIEKVEEQVIETKDETVEVLPNTFEDRIVHFFLNHESSYIAEQIRWIGTETAEKIKKQSPLTFEVLRASLTDRQYNSAKEYLEGV